MTTKMEESYITSYTFEELIYVDSKRVILTSRVETTWHVMNLRPRNESLAYPTEQDNTRCKSDSTVVGCFGVLLA